MEAEDHESAMSSDKREGDSIIWLLKARDVDGFRNLLPKQIDHEAATIGTTLPLILMHDPFQTATISLCRIAF